MDTSKLREALAELQGQRNLLDAAISNIQNVLSMLHSASKSREISDEPIEDRRSYIDDAVTILERAGKPLHAKVIVEQLSEMRGNPAPRASVESSMIRHINKTNGRSRLAKFAPSTFGLAIWKQQQPTLAKIA